ncbi:MAG: hypothetical protein ACI9ES_002596 [Oceanospirillaceae bacterium]|jgi:hypothetical protein
MSDFSKDYYNKGYAFPFDILSEQEAMQFSAELEKLEALIKDETVGHKAQLNYPYVIFKFANQLVRHPKILAHVKQLLGPDILVWSATFFIKEPHTQNYVSWHQDLKYWGLNDNDGQVSAWLALGPVNKENGCMQFIPKSHQGEMLAHNDTKTESNVLTRGQEAQFDLDTQQIIHCELKAGQASFHHGKLLHSSAPNQSDTRRIGLAINYISTKVKQNFIEHDYAMLVSGEDKYQHFIHVPAPLEDLSKASMSWHNNILEAQNNIIFNRDDQSQR